ncbi:MAG TPA: phosphatidylglycerol lysyltransferase domain-containing protein [Candidatus Omnitrophota bacterium]|nr:phosphatidylglycerol lysyltransferase domain-containing protein [Candidatus Omnitrophota bacterium]HPD84484.1 phosphatidylglycerol lysyltransferase domain-containing protein [Candidatus Omnitrophota bacterium]HRZ03342.1 phosphatidylglycerol lysyltransferase domain-containing protein [Candidatus Omnitrophota bacterium]
MPRNVFNQKNIIEEFLNKKRHELSAFSFVNIFTWQEFFEFKCAVIDENLCIFAYYDTGCFLYLPPLGAGVSDRTIRECFRIMDLTNKGSGVSRIENVPEEDLALFSKKEFSFLKKADEYIYRRGDIVSLKGNKFKTKRSAQNHFCKNYRYEFLPYNDTMQQDCVKLYDRWAGERLKTHKDTVYAQMIEDSRSAHRLALKNYEALGLVGRVVCVDGEIKAYTFGFKLNPQTFCVLLEITDLSVQGLSVFIFNKFCDDEMVKGFDFINAMDDFGLENIKITKMSFHPCRLAPSFVVSRRVK